MKKQVVHLLFRNREATLPWMSRVIRLSIPTITKLVLELAEEGIVIETGSGPSTGGRKPTLFSLNPRSRFVLAYEVTRTAVWSGLFCWSGELEGQLVVKAVDLAAEENLGAVMAQMKSQLLEQNRIEETKLIGTGVAFPGLLDLNTGMNLSYPFPGGESVASYLAGALGNPVVVDNCARLTAYGEMLFGAAKGYSNVLSLNISAGLGLGIILDGKIFRGSRGFAGEFGHTMHTKEGKPCFCGRKGCLEGLVSGPALLDKLLDLSNGKDDPGLSKAIREFENSRDYGFIMQLAVSGHPLAEQIILGAIRELAVPLAGLVNLFDPQAIIMGGMLSNAGDHFPDVLRQSILEFALPQMANGFSVHSSRLGEMAPLKGAFGLLMDKLFNTNLQSLGSR